jgi:hypothetical protein
MLPGFASQTDNAFIDGFVLLHIYPARMFYKRDS